MQDFIFNMANTSLITAAFCTNDYSLFARSLNDVVVEPVRSRLITGFDDVKENALKAGADGVAISGSGPTVFAITDTASRARFIEDAIVRTFRAHGVKSSSLITEEKKEMRGNLRRAMMKWTKQTIAKVTLHPTRDP